MTIASYITLLRIILIFPIIYLTFQEIPILNSLSLILFIFAGITDYLDGYIARKTQTETNLGALLDLLADKLLVCLVLVWLVYIHGLVNLIIPVMIILSRELIISSVRQFIQERLGEDPVKVSNLGKSKATLQFIATSFLIISPNFGEIFNLFTIVLVWIAALISVYSLLQYLEFYKEYLN